MRGNNRKKQSEVIAPANWYAVDFGNSAVKGIHLVVEQDLVTVKRVMNFNMLSLELQMDKKRRIMEFQDLDLQTLTQYSIERIFDETGRKEMRGALSLSAPFTIVKSVDVPLRPDAELDDQTLYEIPNHIPEYNKSFVSYVSLDKNPENKSRRLLLAAVRRDIVSTHLKTVLSRHLFPDILTFEFYPFCNFIRRYCKPTDTQVIVHLDFGASKTGLTFISKQFPIIHRHVPVGGNHVTEEIKRLSGQDLINAERLKITGVFESGEISLRDLASVNSIIENIERTIVSYSQMLGGSPSYRLMMSGGGARLAGMQDYLAERLALEVELFNPLDFIQVRFDIDEIEQQGLLRNINVFSHVFTLAMLYEHLASERQSLNILDEMDIDQSFWSASRSRRSNGEGDTTVQEAEKEFYQRIKKRQKTRQGAKPGETRRRTALQQRTPDLIAKMRIQYISVAALALALAAVYIIYLNYLPARKELSSYNKRIAQIEKEITSLKEFLGGRETHDLSPPVSVFADKLARLSQFVSNDGYIDEIRLANLPGISADDDYARQFHRKLIIVCTTYDQNAPARLQQRLNSSGLFDQEFLPFEITSWNSTETGVSKITFKLEAAMKKQYKARAVADKNEKTIFLSVFNPEPELVKAATIGLGTKPGKNDLGILVPEPKPLQSLSLSLDKLQPGVPYYVNLRKFVPSEEESKPYEFIGETPIPFHVEF